jgi:hypothetical protein
MKYYIKKYLKYKNKYIKFKKKNNNKKLIIIKGGERDNYEIDKYPEYKQASGFVLYRIKLGYIYNYNKNYNINFMGEAFDLSIGTTNSFFGALKIFYSLQHGIHFTLDKFILELMEIIKTPDDKTDKRKIRLDFLKKCNDIHYLKILFRDMCSYLNGGIDKNGLIFTVSGGNILKIFVKLIDGFNNDINNNYDPYKFFVNISSYDNNIKYYIKDIKNLCETNEFKKMKEEAENWSDFDFSLLFYNKSEPDEKLKKLINPTEDNEINNLIDSNKNLKSNNIEINKTVDGNFFEKKNTTTTKTVCDIIDKNVTNTLKELTVFIKDNIEILTFRQGAGTNIRNTIRILKNNNIKDFITNYNTSVIGAFLYPQIIQKQHLKTLESNYDNILKTLDEDIKQLALELKNEDASSICKNDTYIKLNKIKKDVFSDKNIYIKIIKNLLAKKKLIEFTTKLNIYNILNEYKDLLFSNGIVELDKQKTNTNDENFQVLHIKNNTTFEDTNKKSEFELFIIIDYLFSICNKINSNINSEGIGITNFQNITNLCEETFVEKSIQIMKNFKNFHTNLYKEINKNMIKRNNIQNKYFNILQSIMTNYKTEAATIKNKLTYNKFSPGIDGCQISANIVELENFENINAKVLADMQDYFSSVNMNNFIEQSDNNSTTQQLLLENTNNDFKTEENENEFISNLYTMDELEKELNTF